MSTIALQRPRIQTVPEYASSSGAEAVELAAMAGLELDPWEAFVLEHSLGEKADGTWAAFEVGLVVSRQNGKGAILEARELAGLYLLNERLIIHSAHEFGTSLEAFRRLLDLIESTEELSRRVKRVSRSHGEEGIELYGPTGRRVSGGQRIRFRTRTKGGGRGYTGDLLILDEAMILALAFHGALLPTLSARSIVGNPQVWYTGSAVDQYIHEHGLVLARVRERALAGNDPSLAYFEWSLDRDDPDKVETALALDEEAWAAANPALGIRISEAHVAKEQRSMDPRTFAVERLGVGDWPRTDALAGKIDPDSWDALTDRKSKIVGQIGLAFDVTPDRSRAAIAAAGHRKDGRSHVEVIEHKRGTGWVIDRLLELVDSHDVAFVRCDASGPAASLLAAAEEAGLEVDPVTANEHAQACGILVDAVTDSTIRHLGTDELAAAIRGAATRPLGEAWAWSRKSSAVDICPLVAGTLAHGDLSSLASSSEPLIAYV